MKKLKQFRDPDLSLWQSAVDEVVAKRKAGGQAESIGETVSVARPDSSDAMVRGAVIDLTAEETGAPLAAPAVLPAAVTEGALEVAQYCSTVARKLAVAILTGNKAHEAICREQLGKFTLCDPGWLETVAKYVEFQASGQKVPYRVYSKIDDFVIDGKLPEKAKVAIVGDWGTGQEPAKQVLAQIARKQPDIVIHLGDIYYSATDFEVDNYFYKIWNSILDLSKTQTYTLSGNHDMFAGGGPYYRLIDKLGQPASYFCVRNQHWQFVAIDTGLHDRKPAGSDPTFLEDTEVAWLKRRLDTAGGRRTMLLSHHQLFSTYEDIAPNTGVNSHLNSQLGPLLPGVAMWMWGHEHNLVLYKKQMGVLARCVGHGAFPVGLAEIPKVPKHPEILMDDIHPAGGDVFYAHGYALMELDGSDATISYYQDSDEDEPQFVERL